MIKILVKKTEVPNFIQEGATYHRGLGSVNLYNTILVLSPNINIPKSLKRLVSETDTNLEGYIDETGNSFKKQEGDKVLVLDKPHHIMFKSRFIEKTQYDESLQQIINQIKNYNSHDNT